MKSDIVVSIFWVEKFWEINAETFLSIPGENGQTLKNTDDPPPPPPPPRYEN